MAKARMNEWYYVVERVRGRKNWRTVKGGGGSKEGAQRYMKALKAIDLRYGDRFEYRLRMRRA